VGHFSKDCPSRVAQKCHNCGEEGHRKTDCTNERVMQCRNCDEWGHGSRECPKPRDYSRVECRNCGEKGTLPWAVSLVDSLRSCLLTIVMSIGHTHVRCKNPPKEPEAMFDGGDAPTAVAADGGDGGWGGACGDAGGSGGWGGDDAPVAASGGW